MSFRDNGKGQEITKHVSDPSWNPSIDHTSAIGLNPWPLALDDYGAVIEVSPLCGVACLKPVLKV